MPRSVQVLIIAVAAALLAFVAAATAPLHSPWLAEKFQCPAGTSLRVETYHGSQQTPGETGISVGCVDLTGAAVTSERETSGFWLLVGIYFVPSFTGLLVALSLFDLFRRRLKIRRR